MLQQGPSTCTMPLISHVNTHTTCKPHLSVYRLYVCAGTRIDQSSGELHNPIIAEPQVSVPLISQPVVCYGEGGTTPPLESGVRCPTLDSTLLQCIHVCITLVRHYIQQHSPLFTYIVYLPSGIFGALATKLSRSLTELTHFH